MGKLVCATIALIVILATQACLTIEICYAGVTEDADRAWTLFASGDNSGALTIYESLIANHPDSKAVPTWYYRASWCYWQLNKYSDCFAAQEKAVDLTNSIHARRDWQHESTRRYYLVGKYDAAIAVLGKLISENPKDKRCAEWYSRMSLCHSLSGKGGESIKDLDKAIELAATPQFKQNLRENRAIQYTLNGDYRKAETDHRGLTRDYSGARESCYWNREIALCCWKQKKYTDCFRALRQAIASVSDPDTKNNWKIGCGVRAYQVKHYSTVVSVLAEPARKSSSVDLNRLVARSYVHLGNWDKALSAYQLLKKAYPELDREWQLWTGYCYEQQGKYKQAESVFRELIQQSPRDDTVNSACFRLATCLVKEGRTGQAQVVLDDYYRDGEHRPEALHMVQRRQAGSLSNQSMTDTQANEDLDMFPEVDDKLITQMMSVDEL